jgi:hypothetical protein
MIPSSRFFIFSSSNHLSTSAIDFGSRSSIPLFEEKKEKEESKGFIIIVISMEPQSGYTFIIG